MSRWRLRSRWREAALVGLAGCAARADSPPIPPTLPDVEAWWTAPEPCPEGALLSGPASPEAMMPWEGFLELAASMGVEPERGPLTLRCVGADGQTLGPETEFFERYRYILTDAGVVWGQRDAERWTPRATRTWRDGVLHGPSLAFDEYGFTVAQATYVDGVRQGEAVSVRWDNTFVQEWVDGARQGTARWWDPYGVLRAEGRWAGDQRDGPERRWDTEGRVVVRAEWVEGELDRWIGEPVDPTAYGLAWRALLRPVPTHAPLLPPPPLDLVAGDCPAGTTPTRRGPTRLCQRADGTAHGPALEEGPKRALHHYADGVRDGVSRWWGPQGLVVEQGFTAGVLDGATLAWRASGELRGVMVYEMGRPIVQLRLEPDARPITRLEGPPGRVAALRAPPDQPAVVTRTGLSVRCALQRSTLECELRNYSLYDVLVERMALRYPMGEGVCEGEWRPDAVVAGATLTRFTVDVARACADPAAVPQDDAAQVEDIQGMGGRYQAPSASVPRSRLTWFITFSEQGARFTEEATVPFTLGPLTDP
ncbi:MAG: hypothetical protein H6739_40215 [Alphaproteobacteria bacterium]|nr:hypothetical protein [Alphaproteobacteria bacterium]